MIRGWAADPSDYVQHVRVVAPALEVTVLCGAKLYRCCGEGPLVCAKERGHDGPHEDEGVAFG